MAQDICDMCGYYEYDEETESYSCSVNQDEDEMYNFMSGSVRNCPYFQNGDEYMVVRKQM